MAKHVLTLIPGDGIGKEVTEAVMLLDYICETSAADRIRNSVEQAILNGAATPDIGGNDTTTTFTEKIINFS